MRHRPGALAWPWLAAAPVKAPESLAKSQMRELGNQVGKYVSEIFRKPYSTRHSRRN
jgi:hypothetical protein